LFNYRNYVANRPQT